MPCISWTIPEKEGLRKSLMDFLQFNQTRELKLLGGTLETLKVETLHLGEFTQSIWFQDMPSIDMTHVFEFLPYSVTSIHIQNCDGFNQQNFLAMQSRLITYKGLKKLVLELLSFDLEDIRDKYLELL